MTVKLHLLTEHYLEFGACKGSSESIHAVKMQHYSKSHVAAQLF